MNWEPRRPSYPLRWILPPVLALASGLGVWFWLSPRHPSSSEIAPLLAVAPSLPVGAAATAEKSWIDEAFKEEYVASPPRWQVCTEGLSELSPEQKSELGSAQRMGDTARLAELHKEIGGKWPTGLLLGGIWAQQRKANDASQLLQKMLTNRGPRLGYRDQLDTVMVARMSNQADEGPPNRDVIILAYLLHAAGYARILNHEVNEDTGWILRNPIACAKLIKARDLGVLVNNVEDGFERSLEPPGCPSGQAESGLSSHDLYNNLIVAYLQLDLAERDAAKREAEFKRTYQDSPEENPLLAVLNEGKKDPPDQPNRGSWLWAISNAERVLRNRLRESRGYPVNPYLALTLAQLMESALEEGPAEARRALLRQRSDLLKVTASHRQEINETDRPAANRALARLSLIEATRTRQAPALGGAMAQLTPEQRQTAELVSLALSRRQEPKSWAERAVGVADPELQGKLAARHVPWLAACRRDAAVALALHAAGQDKVEQRRLARLAASILRGTDSTPEELAKLQESLGWWERFLGVLRSPLGSIGAALAVALVLAILSSWFFLQLKLRRELFLSFYREEAEQRLRRFR